MPSTRFRNLRANNTIALAKNLSVGSMKLHRRWCIPFCFFHCRTLYNSGIFNRISLQFVSITHKLRANISNYQASLSLNGQFVGIILGGFTMDCANFPRIEHRVGNQICFQIIYLRNVLNFFVARKHLKNKIVL